MAGQNQPGRPTRMGVFGKLTDHFLTLRSRLLVVLGLLMTAAFVASYLVTIYGLPLTGIKGSLASRQAEVFKSLNLTADLKKERLVRWLEEKKADAALLTDSTELRSNVFKLKTSLAAALKPENEREAGEVFRNFGKTENFGNILSSVALYSSVYNIFEKIEILDPDTFSVMFSTNTQEIGLTVKYYESYYSRLPDLGESLVFVPNDSMNSSYHLHIARLIMPPEGKKTATGPAGILVLHIHSDGMIKPLLHTGGGLGLTGEALLVDADRKILTSLKYPLEDGTTPKPLKYTVDAIPAMLAARGEEGIITARDYRNTPVLAAYRYIQISPEEGWGMVVKRDSAEVFGPIYRSQRSALLVALSTIVIFLVMTDLLLKKFTAPITNLSISAKQVENGDLSTRADLAGTLEIRSVAEAFNSMLEQLEKLHSSLENEVRIRTAELETEIHERKQASKSMREANRNLQALIDGSPLAIITFDPSGKIMTWNTAAERIFGWKAEEVVGRISPAVLEQARKEFMDLVRGTLEGERLLDEELVRHRKDGTPINVAISTAPIYDEGTPVAGLAMFADITKRKNAEEALKESEEHFRSVVQTATDAIITVDINGKITSWNRAALDIFGYSEKEALGTDVTVFMPESYVEAHRAGMKRIIESEKGRIMGKTVEVEGLRKTGEIFPLELSLASIGSGGKRHFTAIIRDITERKKLEAQIHHSQKLESLGILAGGIAHDFNNLLMGIMGNASLALPKIPDDHPAATNIKRIEQASIRASDLTNQMLAYSGKGKFVIGTLDMNLIVDEMSQLLVSSVGKKCSIYYNFSPDRVTIEGSSAQIQQLIMNLITNASDAIGDESGSITVTTGVKEFEQDSLTSLYSPDELPGGIYSLLTVSDTGVGMDDETLEKLFDPFYTTKETGRGLGLAAVLGIVRGHKGTIKVKSEPGKGTTFRVLLPFAEITREDIPGEIPPEEGAWTGSGTVLVVDDEEYVRDVATNILEDSGLTVILASDGAEGLEVFRKLGKEIDLVLLDMTMPEMGGKEVFAGIMEKANNTRIILSSGYTEQETCTEIMDEYPDVEFIQKPYRAESLVAIVKKMIG